MPRPIFDIEQYELRGVKPEVFNEKQLLDLNRALGRAHGQIDWTAQLLGYSGPNYWGKSGYKADGTFTWNGLPETMVEKRQLQSATYGVFNKDQAYEYWPAPFNRSKIKASGDHSFHIFEKDGNTLVAPWGQGEECSLTYDPTVFVGSAYVFDGEVEFYNPNDTAGLIKVETFSEGDLLWSRVYILDQIVNDIGVRKKGSDAEFFYFSVRQWKDISDWNLRSIASQFLGVWGNKGASVSLDAQFDALHLHGFDEKLHLEPLRGNKQIVTLDELFASVGGKITPWSAYANQNYGFTINGSNLFYPVPQGESESIDFYEFSDCDIDITVKQLIEDDEPTIVDCCEVDNLVYTRLAGAYLGPEIVNNGEFSIFDVITPEYCVNAVDGGNTKSGAPPPEELYCGGIEGDVDQDRPKGIGSFVFEVEEKTDCALDRLCVEWKFNSELDNGSYDDKYDWPSDDPDPTANCCLADNEETPPPYLGPNLADSDEYTGQKIEGDEVACDNALVGGDYPETYTCDPADPGSEMPSDNLPKMGPWITFDEGEYDEMPYPNENIGTTSVCLVEGDWISFDDGIYEEPTQPNCDDDDRFSEIDGDEIWTYAVFPEYEDCECSTEACLVDNFPYLNMTAYRGSDILDGGEVDINCCIIDDGIMGPGPFESAWNVGPDFTDCGEDSGVNPYYCCLIDNETFVFGDPPYYGPDFVDGCTMNSRFVRLDVKRPNLILNSDLELNDWPPTETDNGVFNVDSWDLDDKDPACLPYYCNISNGMFTGNFQFYDYTIDDCTMSVSNVIDDTCPDPNPPFPIGNLVEEPIISPVYETFIENCKNDSCWSDCDTCDPALLCPPDDIFVKVDVLQGEVLYKMHPGLENAYTPLRLWKAPTLNVTDTVRNHDTDIWNYLVADDNRGTNPEDDYRSFVRLPLEYARDGREWSKARTVCENMLYWSSTSNSVEAKYVDKADPNVFLYEEHVGEVLPDSSTIYFEDFLYSSAEEDGIEGNTQPGFEEARVTYEAPFEGPFQPFVSVDYNPFELRTPDDSGEWRGNYYRFIKEGVLSGHISRDVQNSILELSTGPVYDMSEVKHPLTYFPEEDDKQTIKNYVVSYAYFAADYSASDEPVFEPEQDYCKRNNSRTCSTTDRSGNCIDTVSYAATNYLLHPVA